MENHKYHKKPISVIRQNIGPNLTSSYLTLPVFLDILLPNKRRGKWQ